jgi:hypothetical protein
LVVSSVPKLVGIQRVGDLPKSDWLDDLAFRRMEEVHTVSLFKVKYKCKRSKRTEGGVREVRMCISMSTFHIHILTFP